MSLIKLGYLEQQQQGGRRFSPRDALIGQAEGMVALHEWI